MSEFDDDLIEYGETFGEFGEEHGDDIHIDIYKVGGGTLGESYMGRWGYRVTDNRDGSVPMMGEDIFTGSAKTHAEAIAVVFDFWAAEFGDGAVLCR